MGDRVWQMVNGRWVLAIHPRGMWHWIDGRWQYVPKFDEAKSVKAGD